MMFTILEKEIDIEIDMDFDNNRILILQKKNYF